jgi:hippurate hydrolase
MAKGIAATDGIPESLAPIITDNNAAQNPPTYNDPKLTLRLAEAFKKALGAENVIELPPVMGSENVGRFGLKNHEIPICIFWLGAVDPAKLAESKRTGTPLPGLHSSRWAPLPEPTLGLGVKAMTSAVLDLMKK